jgi:hypothetical protein
MERAMQTSPPDSQALLPASVTLAFQRMLHTWKMLSLVGLGMLAAGWLSARCRARSFRAACSRRAGCLPQS